MTKVEKFLKDEGGEKLWFDFYSNYIDYYPNQDSFDEYNIEYGNDKSIIENAFEWIETSEGEDFWLKLHDKYESYFFNNRF